MQFTDFVQLVSSFEKPKQHTCLLYTQPEKETSTRKATLVRGKDRQTDRRYPHARPLLSYVGPEQDHVDPHACKVRRQKTNWKKGCLSGEGMRTKPSGDPVTSIRIVNNETDDLLISCTANPVRSLSGGHQRQLAQPSSITSIHSPTLRIHSYTHRTY